jgi:acyl-CoA synthetase (AMP-forming)/AMP-acid ligase II
MVHGVPLAEEPGLGALTLPGFLREVCGRYGMREAVAQPRPDGRTERWSYDDLWNRSMDVARSLIASSLGKGERVGILMTNRAEFLTATFGIQLAGGVAAPLSTFSTPEELDYLIAHSACSFLLFEPKVLKKDFGAILRELEPALDGAQPGGIVSQKYPFLTHVVSLDAEVSQGALEPWQDFIARGQTVSDDRVLARARTVTQADPALLMHSSGSTGKPKGILNGQRGVAIQLWRWPRIFGIEGTPRVWTANGLFWSGPFGMAIGSALATGGTFVMQATFDPAEALTLIEAERITQVLGWPHQWAQFADVPNYDRADLSSLRYVAGGNPVSNHPTVATDWVEPTRIYGNTETFTLSSAYPSGTSEDILKGAYGFPLPGMAIKIVDPFTGETRPMGEKGELAVKGATLMLGYIGVPLDTTLDEDGYFHTGDGGYVDAEGRVYWEGRLNDIVKTGGANVSPLEVDDVIRACEGVKVTQTIGLPDDLLGEIVVSCVVLHQGAALTEDDIRGFTKTRLASYKVPRRVLFFDEADLSTTGSAKIKTAELRTLAAARIA